MTVADWVSSVSVVVTVVLLAVVAVDRNRIKQRLNNAEGRVTGLALDLEATAGRVAELQSYLSAHESWEPDATAPAALADTTRVDRWTAEAPGTEQPAPPAPPRRDAPSGVERPRAESDQRLV